MSDEARAPATILAVDDEPQLLRLIERVLVRERHRVLTARDGCEAVELFRKHRDEIDVVILDVIMPPRGAREVMAELRELRPDLPVLLSSGDRIESELQQELEAGCGRFLRKPYVPKGLIAAIDELLRAPTR